MRSSPFTGGILAPAEETEATGGQDGGNGSQTEERGNGDERGTALPVRRRRTRRTTRTIRTICYFFALTFQITLAPSSDTSNEPSRATVTPTGRPHASIALPFSPLLESIPLTKSSMGPGRPLFIGKNTTL